MHVSVLIKKVIKRTESMVVFEREVNQDQSTNQQPPSPWMTWSLSRPEWLDLLWKEHRLLPLPDIAKQSSYSFWSCQLSSACRISLRLADQSRVQVLCCIRKKIKLMRWISVLQLVSEFRIQEIMSLQNWINLWGSDPKISKIFQFPEKCEGVHRTLWICEGGDRV